MARSQKAKPSRRGLVFLCGVAAALITAALAIFPPPSLTRLDTAAYDVLLRVIPTRALAGRIVIVDVDERSLSTIGQWPWRRDLIGELIARVRDGGAAVVALDMVFAEPDRYGDPSATQSGSHANAFAASDLALADVFKGGRVVLGHAMRFDEGLSGGRGCVMHPVAPAVLHASGEAESVNYFHATGVVCNLPLLSEAAGASGFMNAAPDTDGILRRAPLLIELDGRVYPSLALAAVMKATDAGDVVLRVANINSAMLSVGSEHSVPIDGKANAVIRYRGQKGTFPYVSAADVMNARVPDGTLQDKIVFVGTTALGTREVVSTPLDTLFTGVEVQATLADNLLQQDFISRSQFGSALEGFLVLAFGIAVTALVANTRAATGVLASGAAVALLWYSAAQLLSFAGVFVSPVWPTIGVLAALAVMTLVKYVIERSRADVAGRERTNAQRLMIQTLLSLTETRDAETGRHSRRTQQYVRLLAERLSKHPDFEDYLTPDRIELVSSLAPLHDIGKVGVPDHILNKPGALTPDELKEMQRHPEYGYEVILKAEGRVGVRDDVILAMAKNIVYTHHERWDGTGYPRRLRGSEIPIEGRVMAVVDVYDATTTRTLYRPPISHDDAVKFIVEREATHFDPAVVKAFVDVAAQFKIVSTETRD